MNWQTLNSAEQLDQVLEESKAKPVVIFKHSTSCSTSATAKSRLERQWDAGGMENVTPYYLDLLSYRSVSKEIADVLQVRHESPQLLLVQDGMCTYHASHLGISVDAIKKKVEA